MKLHYYDFIALQHNRYGLCDFIWYGYHGFVFKYKYLRIPSHTI